MNLKYTLLKYSLLETRGNSRCLFRFRVELLSGMAGQHDTVTPYHNTCQGLALIIVNQNFTSLKKREGAHEDFRVLTETFRELGFKIIALFDMTDTEILAVIKTGNIMKTGYKMRDRFVCAPCQWETVLHCFDLKPNAWDGWTTWFIVERHRGVISLNVPGDGPHCKVIFKPSIDK